MGKYLVLDIETRKLVQEVKGGWDNIKDFGLAIAITMKPDEEWNWWDEPIVDELIKELEQAPLVITFNGIRFDYEVLQPYGLKPEILYPKSFDILAQFERIKGHRVSLDSVAQATLGEGKSGDGTQAVKWFREGKIDKVIEYCKQDVDLTKQIYEFILDYGYVHYLSLSGEVRTCKMKAEPGL